MMAIRAHDSGALPRFAILSYESPTQFFFVVRSVPSRRPRISTYYFPFRRLRYAYSVFLEIPSTSQISRTGFSLAS